VVPFTGCVKSQNTRVWSKGSPLAEHETPPHSVKIGVWCAVSRHRILGPFFSLGYGLDDRGSRVRFAAEAGNFFLHHRVQNGSGAHSASYPMGTRDSFLGGKAAGA
jgi:hypothetical protein